MTRRLGVRWEPPEHGIAEIADIDPEILAEFSQRTTDLQRRLDEKLTRFRADLARSPTPSERWTLEREAVIDSRPAKPHGTSAAELRQEWQERVRTLGRDPDRIIGAVVGRQRWPRRDRRRHRRPAGRTGPRFARRAPVDMATRRTGPRTRRSYTHHDHRRRRRVDRLPPAARRPRHHRPLYRRIPTDPCRCGVAP